MTTRIWKSTCRVLTTLTLACASLAAQALTLPQPPYQVDGFAMLYGSTSVVNATMWRIGSLPWEEQEAAFPERAQPIAPVTGVEMSTLPVPFHNALREVSLQSPLVLDIVTNREATLSNLVLDVRTLTFYGDITVQYTGTTSPRPMQTSSRQAIPLFKAFSGSPSSSADYRLIEGEEPWWPTDAPFAAPVVPRTLNDAGVYHFPVSGVDTALIWLPNLRMTPEVVQVLGRVSNPTAALGTTYGPSIGDMVIAVQVSAVPEPSTFAMVLLGITVVAGHVKRRRL